MADKISGIILNVRKYNDSNSIVTLYTREHGTLSFITPLGTGKGSNARRSKLMPLSVISTELKYKPGRELQRLGSFSNTEIWRDIYFEPMKRALVLFISEFLYRLLTASLPDRALFDFLIKSLRFLDNMTDRVSDFHIPFLVSVLSFSGIQPDVSGWKEGHVFDFASGSFVEPTAAQGPVIEKEQAKIVATIARINFSNMKCLRLTSANRRQILYSILNYYSYHFPGLGSLKSPEILREIFE